MEEFTDKIILVTGAAGNIGQAVVKAFINRGGTVCGLDHRSGRMDNLIRASQTSKLFFPYEKIDVTDREGMETLAERIHHEIGLVDVLVNTVGGFSYGELVHELSQETWQRMMNLNVQSFLSVSAAFVPHMLEKGRGKIITIGAKAALKGSPNTGAYGAAKAALLRLTESMAEELKLEGITVNSVIPGIIDTPENRQDMPGADYSKWVSPEAVADLIVFLSSPESDRITGAAIPIYG